MNASMSVFQQAAEAKTAQKPENCLDLVVVTVYNSLQ